MCAGNLTQAEIEALRMLNREYRECGDWTFDEREEVANALPRLLAMLTPPADAAVREAVDICEDMIRWAGLRQQERSALRTLLSHVRAAQAPRLTGERLEAVKDAVNRLDSTGYGGDERASDALRAAFPDWEEVPS